MRAGPARAMAIGSLALACCGCSGQAAGGSVSIMVPWSGRELAAFTRVIRTFEDDSGITVQIESTRALTQDLDADGEQGDLPDVAALPSIGAIDEYARSGELKPLDLLVDAADYGPPWSSMMRPGTGRHIYAVPVKVDVKSLIWYDPAVFRAHGYRPQASWAGLLRLEKSIETSHGSPWCLGVSSPFTMGWPGTDWISDILLSRYGPAAYQAWVRGELPWASGPVAQSWLMWARLIGANAAVYGGQDAALRTSVDDLHPDPGGCYMEHGTLVDEAFPYARDGRPELRYGTDYAFFPFPDLGFGRQPPIQVSADFLGMFHDTPRASGLIRFLAGAGAQREWVGLAGADGYSANDQVGLSAYRGDDPAMVPIARLLRQRELCFGAADAMPPDASAAFDQAIMEYLADPSSLTRVLRELARVPRSGGSTPPVCGTPGQAR